jgi:hypothetical protein
MSNLREASLRSVGLTSRSGHIVMYNIVLETAHGNFADHSQSREPSPIRRLSKAILHTRK